MAAQSKPSRVDDAYVRLKSEILNNRMPPGFQAPEPEIALRLGMSRTPVREALIRLATEGLVELVPRRGMRVLPISPADMREIYQLLTVLEPEAAAVIAERKPHHDELATLTAASADMERALDAGDLDAWAAADDRFHRGLLAMHHNRRLRAFVENLLDQAHRARMLTLRLRDLPRRSTKEHHDILTYIAAGEAEKARAVFKAHRMRAASELLAILEKARLTQL